ncbi:hypothetical protein PHYC_01637 [Phycisphaerales bacterium]|nr:hypothetical protein PHYC_01637 [Phycisphaerales bacterium]
MIRPVRGFGRWGCILLPVAAFLAFCALGGFDLRHEIIRVCYERFGYDWVFDVILRNVLFGAYWSSLAGTTPGPITLLPVLIAMHLAPRRWAWWQWAIVPTWLLLNPYLCFEIARRVPPWAARALGWSNGPRVVYAGELVGLMLIVIVLLAVFTSRIPGPALSLRDGRRSRWRFAPLLLVASSAAFAIASWAMNRANFTGTSFTMAHFVTLSSAWQVSVAVFTIGPALAARRRVLAEPWRCSGCAYDLRGLAPSPAPACPECGHPVGTMPPCPSPSP